MTNVAFSSRGLGKIRNSMFVLIVFSGDFRKRQFLGHRNWHFTSIVTPHQCPGSFEGHAVDRINVNNSGQEKMKGLYWYMDNLSVITRKIESMTKHAQ